MRRSTDAILTSHAGSLPRPDDLIAVNAQREAGKIDEAAFQKKLGASVGDVVKRQNEGATVSQDDAEISAVGRVPSERHDTDVSTREAALAEITVDAFVQSRALGCSLIGHYLICAGAPPPAPAAARSSRSRRWLATTVR